MKRLRLPHESDEITLLIQQMKDNVRYMRTAVVGGVEVNYAVCSPWPDGLDDAMYDWEGNIFLPESRVRTDPTRADLTAYHEHVEIRHKLAGRSHAYAHRRALLMELIAAKQIFCQPSQLRSYVHYRAGGYPEWKVPNKEALEARLYELLVATKPLRGKLLKVITENRM